MADGPTPDYAQSDHAEIVGYSDHDGRWRWVEDEDWRPPQEEDLVWGDRYLIRITDDPDDSMPDIVQWHGPIDGVTLDDIYNYYADHYQELG